MLSAVGSEGQLSPTKSENGDPACGRLVRRECTLVGRVDVRVTVPRCLNARRPCIEVADDMVDPCLRGWRDPWFASGGLIRLHTSHEEPRCCRAAFFVAPMSGRGANRSAEVLDRPDLGWVKLKARKPRTVTPGWPRARNPRRSRSPKDTR